MTDLPSVGPLEILIVLMFAIVPIGGIVGVVLGRTGTPGTYAKWWQRVGASCLDFIIRFVPLALGGLVLAFTGGFGMWSSAPDHLPLVFIPLVVITGLLVACIAPLFMMRKGDHNGQSIGKQAAAFTVVRDNGQPIGFWFAVLREVVVKGILIEGIGGIIFYIPTLLNYLWALWDDQNRCLHDMIVSTHVVPVGSAVPVGADQIGAQRVVVAGAHTVVHWKHEDEKPNGEGVGPARVDSGDSPESLVTIYEWPGLVARSVVEKYAAEHGYDFVPDE